MYVDSSHNPAKIYNGESGAGVINLREHRPLQARFESRLRVVRPYEPDAVAVWRVLGPL